MSDLATQQGQYPTLDANFERNFGEFVDWITARRAQGDVTVFDLGMIAAGARKLFVINTTESLPDLDDDQLEEEWQEYYCQDGEFLGKGDYDETGFVWPTDLSDY